MRDYVGRQDVLVLLDKIERRTPDNKEWLYQEARHEILNMPPTDVREVMESVWIPVSERLPELDMTKPDECIYLVWCDNEVGYGLGYYTNESIFSPNAIGEPHWIIPRFSNVIAWCRLPKPYKSDEKTT